MAGAMILNWWVTSPPKKIEISSVAFQGKLICHLVDASEIMMLGWGCHINKFLGLKQKNKTKNLSQCADTTWCLM